MDTLTITRTLTESIRFEKQFKLHSRAIELLSKVKLYYTLRDRNRQELDSETIILLPGLKPKIEHKIRKYNVLYNFADKQYQKVMRKLNHNH